MSFTFLTNHYTHSKENILRSMHAINERNNNNNDAAIVTAFKDLRISPRSIENDKQLSNAN